MSRLGTRLSPILVGRDDLLDLAERRLMEASAGHRQFLLLAGEAGIGKSRLMGAIDTKARAAGFHSGAGYLSPQDRDVPVALLLDMARSMMRTARWADLGNRLVELTDESVTAPRPQRRLLVLRMVDLMVEALDEPTVLAFDDLQWADDLSLEILTELARATADRPLLIVGAYRTDELPPGALLREWRARLLTQRAAEEARLAPLTLEQAALMTTLILDTGLPAPRDVVAAVHERTDGVPLHIEELLGAMAEHERTDSRAIRDAAVPDTLEDAILQRIGRLSPEAQEVARSGAVIGRCFVPDVLAVIMDVPPDTLDAPLRELLDEHVLEAPGARGLHDFRHQVLRDVLYRSLPDAQRRRLHARAGEFGRELEGASEIHASVHFERAGMTAEAFHSAVHGARIASRLASHREAFELYRRAVDNLPADLPTATQGEILAAYAVEAAAVEEIAIAEGAASQARERYVAAGDLVSAAAQWTWLTGLARRQARPVAGRLTMIEAAMAEVAELPAGPRVSGIAAELHGELACTWLDGLDFAAARAAVERGLIAARDSDDDEVKLWLTSLESLLDALVDPGREPLDRMAAVAREARERGFEDCGVTAYRDASVAAARVMDYRRAGELIEEGMRYADSIEQSHCAHIMAATGALVAWADGRWDEAMVRGGRAVADRGCKRGEVMARWPIGYTALGRGELAEAATQLLAAETLADGSGLPDMILAASWGLAELALLTGDHDDAIGRTDRALEIARRSRELGRFAPFAVVGVRARLAAGRPGDAEHWLSDASELLREAPSCASPAVDHAAGLLALGTGSLGSARASLQQAVRGWDERGRTWEGLWARLDLASCLVRVGRTAEAMGVVAEVRGTAERLRSQPLLERAEAIERLGRQRRVEQSPWYPLTAREYEVARLVGRGMTNREIAAELSVAPRTVSAHVEHVLAKLGAARRAEIASWVVTVAPVGRGSEWAASPMETHGSW